MTDTRLMNGLQAGTKANAGHAAEDTIRSVYERVLVELTTNRFEWSGLPREIDVRFLEMTILRHGLSIFYWEPLFDKFLAAAGSPSGTTNIIDQPTGYTVPGRAGYQGRSLTMFECVPIWGNYTRVPDLDIILMYAKRLASIERSIEINTTSARRPRVLVGSKDQRMTMANINRQIDEGVAAIGVGPNFDPTTIQALDMGINPQTLEQLHTLRTREWNTAMGLLGINNANQDKKERLVADEVAANDEQVSAMKNVALNARRQSAAQMNAMYGLNVSVDFHGDVVAEAVPGNDVGASDYDEETTE